MATYFEELVRVNSREQVKVCVPHDKYSEFLSALTEHNKHANFQASITSLRPNVKRITKGALSYEDFRGAYF
jgi:hypothetical protein